MRKELLQKQTDTLEISGHQTRGHTFFIIIIQSDYFISCSWKTLKKDISAGPKPFEARSFSLPNKDLWPKCAFISLFRSFFRTLQFHSKVTSYRQGQRCSDGEKWNVMQTELFVNDTRKLIFISFSHYY